MWLDQVKSKPSGAANMVATTLRTGLMVSVAAVWFGAMSPSTATAGTIVESWDFRLDNAFIAFTQTGVGGPVTGTKDNPVIMAPTLLSWGVPFGLNPFQSSLQVGNDPDGVFDTPTDGDGPPIVTKIEAPNAPLQIGTVVPTVMVTHSNFAQEAGSAALDTATLLDVLTLFPLTPVAGGPVPINPLAFLIKFKETPNGPNSGDMGESGADCADITSPDGNGCNDIFVIDVPAPAMFDITDGSLNQTFVFDTYLYNIKIQLEGISPPGITGLRTLTDAECLAVGEGSGCIGLTTEEDAVNMFQTSLSIQLLGAAPEPGALALFGFGLAGLGFARRKRAA